MSMELHERSFGLRKLRYIKQKQLGLTILEKNNSLQSFVFTNTIIGKKATWCTLLVILAPNYSDSDNNYFYYYLTTTATTTTSTTTTTTPTTSFITSNINTTTATTAPTLFW